MELPKVSIGFINCNRLHYLKSCVESFMYCTQDYQNKELIIVDNNSVEEGTEEYLKQKDTCDIVQKELGNKINEKKVDLDSSVPLDCTEESIIEKNVDRDVEAFQNNNNVKTCTLDTYIIKKPIKKKDPIPPPQKIKVKLKTKELKNKDVNKKNINKKYDYGTKNIEETNKT